MFYGISTREWHPGCSRNVVNSTFFGLGLLVNSLSLQFCYRKHEGPDLALFSLFINVGPTLAYHGSEAWLASCMG